MSDTENNTPIDGELKTYLAGEDGISAAYRQAGSEDPPAELDRLILAAARDALHNEKPRAATGRRQNFAVAASFMVGVLVTSMYFNQQSDFADTAASSQVVQQPAISVSAEQPVPAFAPTAPVVTADNVQSEPLAQEVAPQVSPRDDEIAGAAAPAAPATLQAAQKAEGAAAADNAATTRTNIGIANSAVRPDPQAGARVAETAVASPAAAETTAAPVAETLLEETMVTGSRVANAGDEDLSYRQTREAWLNRILALGAQALGAQTLLEETNARLDEELKLFSETYPDFDLEAKLEELKER